MESLKQQIHGMSEENYINFMKEVHLSYPKRTVDLTNKLVNAWKKFQKKEVTSEVAKHGPSSGQQSKVVSSLNVLAQQSPAIQESGSGQKCKSVSSPEQETGARGGENWQCQPQNWQSQPQNWQKSAWKTGVIFRGDKVPEKGNLFMDVEKVTLKKSEEDKTHKQQAATISIVNEDAKVVLWAFIKTPHEEICQYSPQITNLNERKLGIGIELAMVHTFLDICLKGNRLVGVAIENDLKSLGYNSFNNFMDLHDLYQDDRGPFALGHIVKKLLSNRSGFQQGQHSAIDDARMTLAVYKHYKKSLENETFDTELMKLSLSREQYKKEKPKFFSEPCKCRK